MTTRRTHGTRRSHINQVVQDSQWEKSAAFYLEQWCAADPSSDRLTRCYARNERPFLLIPYEYEGVSHHYEPDYLVRLEAGFTLVLEIKGLEGDREQAKHQAARRWVSAVNNWGQLGRWAFLVCRDAQRLGSELAHLCARLTAASPASAPPVRS